jgi:type I restriction enzyme S subunit
MTGWHEVRVEDVAVVYDGPHATPASPKTAVAGPVFLGISSLQNGRLDLAQSGFLSDDDFARWTRRVTPQAGDVVFSYETRIGQAAIVPPGLRCALGRRLALMRPDRNVVDPRFLLYSYLGPAFQETLRLNTVAGSTVDRILLRDFPSFPLLLPPIAEQAGIAAMLGALDDKIASNRRIDELCLALAVETYRAASLKTSQRLALGNAGKWLSGGTPSTEEAAFWNGDFPWISAASLKSFHVAVSDRRLTSAGLQRTTNVVPAGTVLMVVRGMSLKSELRMGVAQRPVAFGQDCKAIIPTAVPSALLATALYSARSDILELVDEAGHGTGRLQWDLLSAFPIAVPDDDGLVLILDALLARGAAAAAESRKLAELRDALLPELLSGRLRVPEASGQALA